MIIFVLRMNGHVVMGNVLKIVCLFGNRHRLRLAKVGVINISSVKLVGTEDSGRCQMVDAMIVKDITDL